MTTGRRKRNGKEHLIMYAGKESLLEMLSEAEDTFFNLFETAAREGWISGDRFLEFDQSISHLVIKYGIPQSPE
jgi:hypothetical protein